jgi:hypothetical protein
MPVLDAEVPVEHRVWVQNSGPQQHHGQASEGTYSEPITRYAYQVYPARWQRPTPDPINIEDLARTDINLLMDVPDATVYKNQDQVLINGTAFVVQGNPGFEDWGDGMQLMSVYDDLLGGGQVLIRRVT